MAALHTFISRGLKKQLQGWLVGWFKLIVVGLTPDPALFAAFNLDARDMILTDEEKLAYAVAYPFL